MAGFRTVRIADMAEVKGGKRLPANANLVSTPTSHPYIRGRDIRNGEISFDEPMYVLDEDFEKIRRYTVDSGDVCLTIVGNIGDVGITPPHLHGASLTENAVKLVNLSEDFDARFLMYALLTRDAQSQMKLAAAGAAQPKLGIYKVNEIKIPAPPKTLQRRIAGMLSAYDELMENSQRRIRILEAMSRALYREWFVQFRLPGHEKIPRVASPLGDIPKSWEATTLRTQLSALESGKRPKGGIRDVEDGVPSIGAENINGIGKHDFVAEKFVPREFFQEMRKGVVRDRDVAIYKDGAYIGKSSYFRDGFPHTECCVNEHVFLLRSNGVRLKQNALYLWLQEPDTVQAIRSTNANAAQPGINQQSIRGLELIVPDSVTAIRFDKLVEPLIAGIVNHAKRIQNLRRTRNILLPRLLSSHVALKAA